MPTAYAPQDTRTATGRETAADRAAPGTARARSTTATPSTRRRRVVDALWLAPLLIAGGVLNAIGLFRSPQFIDDEGTYTAQAYAVERLGELTHYTYWYDHPPLGWLQMAAWTSLTGAFDRVPSAVMAGREVMLIALIAASALLWVLVRRIGAPRVVAAASVLLFMVSPLAVQLHRTVYLDNIAVVWMLLAFVLATARHRQLAAFIGAAFAIGIAVLTKETFLLMLPFVAWVMVRHAAPSIRRYTLTAAGSVVVLVGTAYLVFALLKGELLPGTGRVSLWDAIAFQLAERDPSGSLTDPDSYLRATTDVWVDLDPVFLVAASVAMIAGLFIARVRPYAAALLLMVAIVLRPGGYVPVPHIVGMLPLMALLVPVVVWLALRAARRRNSRVAGLALAVPVLALSVGAGAIAAPLWAAQIRGQVVPDFNEPVAQAQAWLEDHASTDYRMLVDNVMWVDLVEAGFPRDNVVWYYKADTDPEVITLSPGGWQDYDYVVTTASMRTFPGAFPVVSAAIENSTTVASFGEGDREVDIRRVRTDGIDAADARDGAAAAERERLGEQLARHPGLTFSGTDQDGTPAQDAVSAGRVDSRLAVTLSALASTTSLSLQLEPVPGELGQPVRAVTITALDGDAPSGADATQIQGWFENQNPGFRPLSVESGDEGVTITYPLPR